MCYQCTKMHWSLMYTKYIREVGYVVLILIGVSAMSISVFDIRTGNHRYEEEQIYEVCNGPGPGEWFTLRDGKEVRILWWGYLNHPLHSPTIKKRLKEVLNSGALDYGSPRAKETLKELYEWVLAEARRGDS